MGVTDDMAPLYRRGGPGVRFRQGVVLAWDPATGANTIDLGGSSVTDVPILNTGEAIALRAGHVVGLLGQGKSWFIIGRVTPPNDPSFAGASLAFASQTASETNFTVPTALTARSTVVLDVPAWADEAAVMATGILSAQNTTGGALIAVAQAFIAGDGGPANQVTAPATPAVCSVATAHSRVVVSPGATITCEMRIRQTGGAGWAVQPGNIASLSALAIFRSTT